MHTLELGLERAEDDALLMLAAQEGGVIVSGDTDFGALLALLRRPSPSVILFRSRHALTAEDQATIILDHLDDLESDLESGAVVVVGDDRIRVASSPAAARRLRRRRRDPVASHLGCKRGETTRIGRHPALGAHMEEPSRTRRPQFPSYRQSCIQ